MNIFDKIVEQVSPEQALKRTIARKQLQIMNSGYSNHGASSTKKSMKGWNSRGGSTDDDIITNLPKLRERSRDLCMGDSISAGATKTLRTNVIGTGLKLKSQIDNEILGLSEEEKATLERQIEKEFSYWADTSDCDAVRQNNFFELQQLAQLSWLQSGDCFALLPIIPRKNCLYDLRIRLLEADRVLNPAQMPAGKDISGGVEVDKNGEIVAYHVAQWHPSAQTLNQEQQKNRNKYVRLDVFGGSSGRRNILHLMENERPEQRRGVPYLSPVIEDLKQLCRYAEAEVSAAVVSAMFTVFITSDSPQEVLGEGIAESDQVDSSDENSYELGNASIIGLAPGENIQQANPGRPNANFESFVMAFCRRIGAGLELPYELLLKHFTSSYSASRAALLMAWSYFRMRRAWMANDFCQPIYEEWFAEAVAKGRIAAPGFFEDPYIRRAYTKAEWVGPSMGILDPVKEVNASKIRVEEGFSTRARETAELTGGDWEEYHKQRVKEEQMRREGQVIMESNNNDNTDEQPDEPDNDN